MSTMSLGPSRRVEKDPFLSGQSQSQKSARTATDRPAFTLADPRDAHRANMSVAIVAGAYLPSFVFALLVCLFTYVRHISPAAPWLAAFFGGTFLAVGALPPAKTGGAYSRWDWLPLLSSFFAVSMGVSLGLVNSSAIQPWVRAEFLNHYRDVLPDADPLTVSDAGIIDFAKGTVVNTVSSAGFHAWPYTYCAAPIVSSSSSDSNVRAGFWAVGMNCCSDRGLFSCDVAAGVQSGLRVDSDSWGMIFGHDAKEQYMRAVRMAAASYDVDIVGSTPVLVAWSNDPQGMASAAIRFATALVVVQIAAAVCCSFSCQTGISRGARKR